MRKKIEKNFWDVEIIGNRWKKYIFRHFNFMTECPSGKLSKTHLQRLFKRVFPVGDSENFCDYIFRLFDDDGNNVLEFKEFLQVSSIYFLRFSIGILEEFAFLCFVLQLWPKPSLKIGSANKAYLL